MYLCVCRERREPCKNFQKILKNICVSFDWKPLSCRWASKKTAVILEFNIWRGGMSLIGDKVQEVGYQHGMEVNIVGVEARKSEAGMLGTSTIGWLSFGLLLCHPQYFPEHHVHNVCSINTLNRLHTFQKNVLFLISSMWACNIAKYKSHTSSQMTSETATHN